MNRLILMIMVICAFGGYAQESSEQEAKNRQKLVDGNNVFAWKFYAENRSTTGNMLFSPFSISSAFAMPYSGAAGATAEEIKKLFDYPLNPNDLFPLMVHLQSLLEVKATENADLQFSLANSMWVQAGFPLLPEFLKTIKQGGNGTILKRVDFSGQPEQARSMINGWVRGKTQGKIAELLSPEAIKDSTRLVLVNALYFRGRWQTPFNKSLTHTGAFFTSQDQTLSAQMMEITGPYAYLKNDRYALLELPYMTTDKTDSRFAMIILLPNGRNDEIIIRGISNSEWQNLVSQMSLERVNVHLPRFRFSWGISLNAILQKMGLKESFTEQADFSLISDTKKLLISEAIHKAYISVEESGTEAAAATSISMNLTAVPTKPVVFKADHPFLFAIIEKESGVILFLGRVLAP